MLKDNNETYQPMTFDAIKIGLASPQMIKEWAWAYNNKIDGEGEVKKPETINYRTLKPEKDGLFCEKIFGPSKDWECNCGKYKKIRYKDTVCDKCNVQVTKASVRRERMGYIKLASPVSHIWYFKGIPSRMGLLLDISPKALEKVLYFADYIVLEPGNSGLAKMETVDEKKYNSLYVADEEGRKRDLTGLRLGMGAEAILELLKEIDLDETAESLKKELENASGQKRAKIIKRLEVVEAFRESGNDPAWMILENVPVIPPDIRPMVQLDGGRFATSDLNDLYRRIINRNNRLARLLELKAPEIIVRNEKRMLQEAVDALIDNGRRGRPVSGPGNRPLKSLSDMLKGKQGRFRQNLLGKRVDYSGRSVIVVGPELKIYQCGLPKEMAIELFKPFVMKELCAKGIALNIRSAKKMVESLQTQVWDILEDVIKEHPVMLNRAPTLHRLGIQAFEPILVEGKAIKLHPLVCTAFNADFDGDQMAVHLPLSVEAQAECRFLLLSPNNLLKPSDGGPVAVPSQDMVLGIYYLTQERPGALGEGKFFKSVNEAILAYENGVITLHSKVKIKITKTYADGSSKSGIIETTLGRCLFNEILPQDLGFVDRSKEENEFLLEVDFHVGKKNLKKILEKVINTHGATKTAEVLDSVKAIGYKYSTRAAMTVSISDMTVPAQKKQMIADTEKMVDQINKKFRRGFLTESERYNEVVSVWKDTDDKLTKALLGGLDKYNNIFMMADSGARGSDKQIKQLAGMRGLMADTTGKTIELPIKSNFREGLDVLEYFISAHGARKGLSDTALRTADSGYLTRRLVDVAQELIVKEVDCCEGKVDKNGNPVIPGMYVYSIFDGKSITEELPERITGRYLAEDIVDAVTGEVVLAANHMVTPKRANQVYKALFPAEFRDDSNADISEDEELAFKKSMKIKIRTILTCRSHVGVCAKCYGANMATGQAVQIGEAVGIIAAQSIGEPGTQLTMRTFHTGGVAGDDITQGLPRVEELFEARKPKGLAILTEFGGEARVVEEKGKREVVVTNTETGEEKRYLIPYASKLKIKTVDENNNPITVNLEAGDELTEGSINPHDLLRIKGVRAVQDYMISEVQRVYRSQGVDINDKHIEVIVRQMLKKIRVETAGETEFLPGTTMDVLDFNEKNEALDMENKEMATGTPILLGITKASLATNSFLSAASFQETTKVLTEAAISGKIDPLVGLKENVIIGKLIPAGTGMKRYRNVHLNTDAELVIPTKESIIEARKALAAAQAENNKEKESYNDNEDIELSEDMDDTEEFDAEETDGDDE